jgi:hypothetical protein
MRIKETTKIVLSEDTISDPKKIRYSEDFEDIDTTLLTESITKNDTLSTGTHVISMGNIAAGKFLCIKPDADLGISINGGATITIRADKVTKMWATITSLSLIATEATDVSLVLAGT